MVDKNHYCSASVYVRITVKPVNNERNLVRTKKIHYYDQNMIETLSAGFWRPLFIGVPNCDDF